MQLSAGVLVYRLNQEFKPEFLLAHPGGPYYTDIDENSWSIPKGGINKGEDAEICARREFNEETGFVAPANLQLLGTFKVHHTKIVNAFIGSGDYDAKTFKSNTFEMNYCGKIVDVPEIDNVDWFDFDTAMKKANHGQKQIIKSAMYVIKESVGYLWEN
ncbi:MAG: NUDIX domain-containing protein [Paludibacteraceae bacterium]|nr:NUDIX domain-containing protein [Paludibacteraceae bacterium]